MPEASKKKDYNDEVCPTLGPGPAAYLVPSTVGKGPAFSITGRKHTSIRSDSPGPIYNVYGLSRFGTQTCATGYSINSRVKGAAKYAMPGPGTYAPEKFPYPMGRASPAYSIQSRTGVKIKSIGPGPNQYIIPTTIGYKVPDLKGAPAALLMGRISKAIKSVGPGPAAYGVPNYDAIKYIFPAVSLSGRTHKKMPWTSPGPLAYYPKYMGPTSPAYSIRSRVGKCVKPYITPLDNCD